MTTLTTEQIDALTAYAHEHGRFWKSRLRMEWMCGRCSGPLQHLRNIGGPDWLKTVRIHDGTFSCGALPK